MTTPRMFPGSKTKFWFLCASIWLTGILSSHALEPWADDALPVKDGLELWLDASSENAARTPSKKFKATEELPRIANGGPLDAWRDASGNKRVLTQFIPGARPRLIQGLRGMAVRFDGKDDFLMMSGREVNLTNFTIFIQAAPRTNEGNLRAFLAMSRVRKNDYSSGLNVDLGNKTDRFSAINIEGNSFTGIRDMLKLEFPFEQMHVLTIASGKEMQKIKLWVDGIFQDERERTASSVAFDLLTVGARFYSNSGEPAHVQGFFDGDISQVLIYSRLLSDAERASVDRFLASKSFSNQMPGKKIVPLETITNSPAVKMFFPGFEVKEIPVELSNVNCVKYREDGKLVALGYDGTIWLLSDTNGDGLEDKATPFWNQPGLRAPIGMALTPPNYSRGRGVFVPSKGKLSLIVDTNNDDVADEEVIVAKGWNESFHNVDGLGAAIDKDGSIYFGIGTVNFANAYLVDAKTGKSKYDLGDEHGTILKVSPDFSKREIVCTGIRFPVALAFNSAGDLFCTDQEGATWLQNGNPFDELLHIEPGRHYGFPPRHPEYLPSVIDEPSVFDYGPQHQSTCGLNFNEPVNGGPVFGPENWRGDAFVAGYSRGKLYRTKLAKTKSGYVAQNEIIGSINMLLSDICVSPRGEMVVSAHSGKPDWGTGPTGAGKLFKIFYREKLPQPVGVWASSATETLIEFDRPLDPLDFQNLKKKIVVTEGRYVGAGDRFETLRPGYQTVMNQLAEPRFELEVHSTVLNSDRRTLAIRTTPRSSAVNYAITLPSFETSSTAKTNGALQNTIELAYDLSGAEAIWESASGQSGLKIWLPHLDFSVAREFTKQSAAHSLFWSAISKPGKLTLLAQLDLWQMLRSATQPGGKLDFEYPDETVTVLFKADSPIEIRAPSSKVERLNANESRLTVTLKTNQWIAVELNLQTSANGAPALDVSWSTAEDARSRALPLRRIFLPWSKPLENSVPEATERVIPELAGGNWLNGSKIFFGEQAACSKCHLIRGRGAKIGPDLSNLIHRDYPSVLKDILEPSAAINPDHVAYNIDLKDGRESLSGVSIGGNEAELFLADASGRSTHVPRSNIRSMKPSTLSLMPEGLLEGLSESERKDLLTFMLMPEPLQPATIEIAGAPPSRKRTEVEAVLGKNNPANTALKPMHLLLCAGPKDHGPGEHDYPLWQNRWSRLLALAGNVSVENVSEWPTREQFEKASVVIFYSNNPGWSASRATELDSFLNRGGGLVYIHYAVDGHANCEELAQRIGLAWRGGASKFRHGSLSLDFLPHSITKNFNATQFIDESYWNLIGSETSIEVLASGVEEGKSRPLMWVREQGKGRVFVSIPGHYTWTFDDPLFRILILRGIAWSAHQAPDRLSELVTIGARLEE